MISKNIVVTIQNSEEGLTLSLKSTDDPTKIVITGDLGVYDGEEIQKATEEVKAFVKSRDEQRGMGCSGACSDVRCD